MSATPPIHWRHWPAGVPHALDASDETLWQGFAARADREADAVGLDFLGRTSTWGELVAAAERLAGAMQARGLRAGDRVLLFMQNCPQFIVAFHAVVRCAAVVVPVNPMNKADELAHVIEDAGAAWAVASSDIAPEMARASESVGATARLRHLVVFDLVDALPEALAATGSTPAVAAAWPADWPLAWRDWLTVRHVRPTLPAAGQVHEWTALLAEGATPAPLNAHAGELVLLPYTSGTTGLPKGCVHTHATLLHNARAAGPWYDQRPGDVALIVVPMFHITGLVMGLLASIRTGGAIVLMPRWDRLLAAHTIARCRVTHWPNIPTMVIDLLGASELERIDLSSLRYIGGGGAPMPEAVATRLAERCGLTYVEGYGLTESAAPTHSNPRHAARRACLGIPFVSVEALVIDPDTLQPMATDGVGEIVVRGPQIFKGYWNQPTATSNAFIEIDGRRFFRTGDLGRVDAEGYFTLADRLKRMINASGFKVWPAEVEALLYKHPAVQEVCVIALRDPYRGESAKAVIVPRDAARHTVRSADIIAWAREHMAAYKVPREVVFADSLPKTASGKVLWRTLQAQQDEQAVAAAAAAAADADASKNGASESDRAQTAAR